MVSAIFSQDSILGYYEYQTAATERMGEALDILADGSFVKYSKYYSETTAIDSGAWTLNNDTLTLNSSDTTYILKIASVNHLETFLSINPKQDSSVSWLSKTQWTKTKGYHQNGEIESIRSWTSISSFVHELTPHGIWIYYYEDGSLKAVGEYKKGKRIGKWFNLERNGKEKKTVPNKK